MREFVTWHWWWFDEIPCESEFSFYLLEHHFSNSALLCYWLLRFHGQKLFAFQYLNYVKSRSQKCIAFFSFQHFRVHWQAQEEFFEHNPFVKSWLKRSCRAEGPRQTLCIHAQISWIPAPVLKPHCASGHVLVGQTWNLVLNLGIRLGDKYRFFSSSWASNE